jgi:hypothetical protein
MLQLLTVAFAASRDYGSTLTHLNQVSNSIFHTEFQDWYVVGVYHTHEISLALRHLVSAQHHATPVLPSPAALFDSFADSTATTTAECSDYLGSFVPYVAYIVMLAGLTRIIGISNPTDVYTSRLLFYLYSASTTTRLQFEAMLQTFFFIVLYASVTMVTFDDDQEELFEVFHSACYYLLLTTLLYHLYRYSTHCLSYLEAAKSGSKATSLLAQSVFDGLNVFAYTLRFLVLVIRLNIYDGIDDMLDSYYILLADFEEDDYTYDAIVLICAAYSFDMDANDDRLFLLEDETDLFADLFLVYFTVWGKFATF